MKKLIEKLTDTYISVMTWIVTRSAKRKRKKAQSTWVYCACGNEMVGDFDEKEKKNPSFIRDTYIAFRNVVHYKCSKCTKESFYDFDFPAPVLLPLAKTDIIIDLYKKEYTNEPGK